MKIKTTDLIGPALDWAVEVAGGMYVSKTRYKPSSNWEQGGLIIDQEQIELAYMGFDVPPYWVATSRHLYFPKKFGAIGQTPLIAAMRCFVASKLGDAVEVPDEFFNQGEMK